MIIQSQFSVNVGKVGGENVPGLQVKGTMPRAFGRAVDMINHDSNSTGGTGHSHVLMEIIPHHCLLNPGPACVG